VDESMITESHWPVIKKMRAIKVNSGTINGNHLFWMKAEKVGSDHAAFLKHSNGK